MKRSKKQTLPAKSDSHSSKASIQDQISDKLEKIFKIKFDLETIESRWAFIIEAPETFDITFGYLEVFFSQHPDFFSEPNRWESIVKKQESLTLEAGMKYLNAIMMMGKSAYFAGIDSYFKRPPYFDRKAIYENLSLSAKSRIQWTNLATEIFQRRGVSELTDIKRLVALCGKGGFDRPPVTKIIDDEYRKLTSNYDRHEFLELLIAQLYPLDGAPYRELMYKYLYRFGEIVHEIERERIISTVNPKYNGSYILNKVSHLFPEDSITSEYKSEIRTVGMRIIQSLEIKKSDYEKLSLIKKLLDDYRFKNGIVAKVIVQWLNIEYASLSTSPINPVDHERVNNTNRAGLPTSNEMHDKIRWEKSEAGLVYWFELLYRDRAISQSTYDKRFVFMERFFENKNGMPFKRRQSSQAETNSKSNNNPKHKGKPREAPQLDKSAGEWAVMVKRTEEGKQNSNPILDR